MRLVPFLEFSNFAYSALARFRLRRSRSASFCGGTKAWVAIATAAAPPSAAIQQIAGRNVRDRVRSQSSNSAAADRALDRQSRTTEKPDLCLPVQHIR